MKKIYTLPEISTLLNCKKNTFYNYIARQKILAPHKTLTGSFYYTDKDVQGLAAAVELLKLRNTNYYKKYQ
jgi:homoserine acetyltransferase